MNDNGLKVYDLYQNSDSKRIEKFKDNVSSQFSINADYEKVEVSFEWLDMMEDTVRYLDNIMRNPNRFIVNEEEIVKIEQAKRITVESTKHLAKHTNFIQEIDKDGLVRPSKILNINKDESFNTYENRLIYTLIQNMRGFIDIKKKSLMAESSLKDIKKTNYSATAKVGAERISYTMSMDARVLAKKNDGSSDGMNLQQRIEKLELQITDLTNSDVYKSLVKAHVSRIIPPIKKTNLILKNVNFQYAMRLWDYLQNHVANDDKKVKSSKEYKEDIYLKSMFDDTFMLNYLVTNSVGVDKDSIREQDKQKMKEDLTNSLISKIVEINADLPLSQLEQIIGEKVAVVRSKREASMAEIANAFTKNIDKYLNRIENFRF